MTSGYHEILAALCLMGNDSAGSGLFAFASKKEEPLLKQAAARFADRQDPGEVDRRALAARIRQLGQIQSRSALDSIHPGWILEGLADESPRLIGILCRLLSGEQAKYLIEHAKGRLPKMEETYRVSEAVTEIVWKCLEKKFRVHEAAAQTGSFSFPHLVLFKGDDLRSLFTDLGLEEIRRAFHRVEPNVLRAFLSRFSPKEAQEIRSRIEGGPSVAADLKKEAQAHLLAMPMEQLSSALLLREIGTSVFARALLPDDCEWVEKVWQKLPPEEGYRLKRIVQEAGEGASVQDVIEDRRDEIISRVFLLAKKGLIRYYWKL